jgi:hypothetical protein
MCPIDIYSKRHKTPPDVYAYDDIPKQLRAQIVHIFHDLFEADEVGESVYHNYKQIHDLLCREYGVFNLSPKNFHRLDRFDEKVNDFVMNHADHEQVLDVVEVSFKVAHARTMSSRWYIAGNTIARAVDEVNTRFRERGVGYQYESGRMIRVDSQLVHAEVVKPALALLRAPEYAGANAEFMKAFEHYRKGHTKECLNECLKALESTMKAICTKKNWTFKDNDTAKALIDVCLKNGLIPPLIQSHITGVRTTLESGIPTIRNRLSGHGQGATVVNVPGHYAGYMLHLTATTIKFLIESEKTLP